MARNKNLPSVGLFVFDQNQKKWVPFSWDETSEGQKLVTTYNRPNFYTGTVTITSAGTAQQGPAVQIPPGFSAVIKGRDGNTGNVFFAPSATEAQTAASRITVAPGSAARMFITSLDLVWFDAVTTNDVVELFVER